METEEWRKDTVYEKPFKATYQKASLPPRHEKAPLETRRAGRIAQRYRASSVHKPYALTSAQIEEKPKKQHNQKTRRGKRNKKHAQERLAEKNLHRKQNRKMQTDKTRRCNSSAQSGCERTYSNSKPGNRYNQEYTKPKFPKPTLREGSFQDLFKQKDASKTKFVKQYITHRKRYSRNRSTRFCQILIKKGSQYPKYVAKASTLTLPVRWSMARNSRSLRWI